MNTKRKVERTSQKRRQIDNPLLAKTPGPNRVESEHVTSHVIDHDLGPLNQ